MNLTIFDGINLLYIILIALIVFIIAEYFDKRSNYKNTFYDKYFEEEQK